MRLTAVMIGLALALAMGAGCQRQCFLTQCDYEHYHDLGLPPNLPTDVKAGVVPAGMALPVPATVRSPERPVYPLSLAEALAMALEHGTPGSPQLNGTTTDILGSLQGRLFSPTETPVRVLALDPAIVGSDIDASLAKFDARWETSMTWQRTDQPVGGNFLTNFQNGDVATLRTQLLKPLPTGGVAGITFTTAYTLLTAPPAGVTNPAYRPNLQFQFEQPLLQGFGVEINQLRAAHPGSLLTPFNNTARVDGILVTRVRFDQARAEFERQMHLLVTNVEVAYWNLYGAYYNLYTREQALRQSFQAWRVNQGRYERGLTSSVELSQTRAQYESFRGQRLEALNQVLESEHQLRGLLGMAVEDGNRLVPVDTPTLAAFEPDWASALDEALARRPELVLAREDLKLRQFDLINQQNLLMPDLRFTSTYDVNGFGTHLDGGANDPNNALANLADNRFHDWTLGLRLDVPLGRRDASAAVRASQLRLAEGYGILRDQENRTARQLADNYRQLVASYDQIQVQRAQREAVSAQLRGRFKDFLEGRANEGVTTLDLLLEAQRNWADALRSEYAAVVDYNNALARFAYARGAALERNNVVIGEGSLPTCVQVRAVEHERERSVALALRQRALPAKGCKTGAAVEEVPEPSAATAPALLSVLEEAPGLPLKAVPMIPGPPVQEDQPGPEALGQELPPCLMDRLLTPAVTHRVVPAVIPPSPVGEDHAGVEALGPELPPCLMDRLFTPAATRRANPAESLGR